MSIAENVARVRAEIEAHPLHFEPLKNRVGVFGKEILVKPGGKQVVAGRADLVKLRFKRAFLFGNICGNVAADRDPVRVFTG